MLYQSNPCATIEDALFEIKYWLDEDMDAVFEKIRAADEHHLGRGEETKEDISKLDAEAVEEDEYSTKDTPNVIDKGSHKRVGEPLQASVSKRMREDVEMSG